MAIDDDDEVVKGMGNDMGNVKTTDGRCSKGNTTKTIKGSMRPNSTLKTVKEYGNTKNREWYNINIWKVALNILLSNKSAESESNKISESSPSSSNTFSIFSPGTMTLQATSVVSLISESKSLISPIF